MALKVNYSNIEDALKDLQGIVSDNLDEDIAVLTTDFVRWNEDNMFEDTGKSIKDVKNQTDYKKGQVVGRNPYFAYVYYGTDTIKPGGKTGKPEPFEYTWNERTEDIVAKEIELINKRL